MRSALKRYGARSLKLPNLCLFGGEHSAEQALGARLDAFAPEMSPRLVQTARRPSRPAATSGSGAFAATTHGSAARGNQRHYSGLLSAQNRREVSCVNAEFFGLRTRGSLTIVAQYSLNLPAGKETPGSSSEAVVALFFNRECSRANVQVAISLDSSGAE